MRLCPNTYILFRVLNVNTCSALHDSSGSAGSSARPALPAPVAPPASRRRQTLRTEPLVFAVLLTLLTLGINLSSAPAQIDHADTVPVASQLAAAR